jgi:hypothetical protein
MLIWEARPIELNGPSVPCKIQRLPTHENQKSKNNDCGVCRRIQFLRRDFAGG